MLVEKCIYKFVNQNWSTALSHHQRIYLGSIPGRVIPKTLKMVLDTSLLNTQQYKVCIKGKVEQFRERSSALPLHLGVVAIEKGALWSPSTMVANFTYLYIYIYISKSTSILGTHEDRCILYVRTLTPKRLGNK